LQTGDAVPQIVSTIADKYSVEEEIVQSDISELIGELQAARLWP
jgi:hypothetical protein